MKRKNKVLILFLLTIHPIFLLITHPIFLLIIHPTETQKVKSFRSAEFHAQKLSGRSAWIVFATYMCQKCINRSRDIYAPKMRTSLMQQTCKSAKKILTRYGCCKNNANNREKNTDSLETVHTVRKLSILTGNFPHCHKTFQTIWILSSQTVWKISRSSGNFLDHLETFRTDCLETFQTIWKLSRLSITFQTGWKVSILSGNFPPCLETFWTVRKVSRLSGNFPDRLETF